MPLIRDRIRELLHRTVASAFNLSGESPFPEIELEIPKNDQHGDYASNVAMSLTRTLRRSPRAIAGEILDRLEDSGDLIHRVEIAGPGFMNFFVQPRAWTEVVREIHEQGEAYGRRDAGRNRKVQVEFVSANPTGPLHIGHGRGAAIGDVLANILEACGYRVEREYYINDAGNQMRILGRSLYCRYRELLGQQVEFPEDHYQGDYMKDLAREFLQKEGDRYLHLPEEEAIPVCGRFAGDRILKGIREDLEVFGVRFDNWFSERSLHDRDLIRETIRALRNRGYIYEEEGALWFRSTAFGDEKDRVVVRANGLGTYFAADIAYHKDKFDRGLDRVIDIWGADHHGYVARMLAAVEALGRDREDLKLVLAQLVSLLRGGQPVAMSTRAGEFVTLREVIDEVGKDAARFIFLTRRSDSHLDFDLEVAKMRSNDNPVFYVQYAHARLCSVFQVAEERGVSCDGSKLPPLERLEQPQEHKLMQWLGEYPEVLAASARSLEPHRIPYYLHELVSLFHSYYNRNRILGEDAELTRARLYLAEAVRIVLQNALGILGVSAPRKM